MRHHDELSFSIVLDVIVVRADPHAAPGTKIEAYGQPAS
jgi:hypothetical protein